jgi:hypothetical protein
LRNEAEAFVGGEGGGEPIDLEDDLVASLPNYEVGERLHPR